MAHVPGLHGGPPEEQEPPGEGTDYPLQYAPWRPGTPSRQSRGIDLPAMIRRGEGVLLGLVLQAFLHRCTDTNIQVFWTYNEKKYRVQTSIALPVSVMMFLTVAVPVKICNPTSNYFIVKLILKIFVRFNTSHCGSNFSNLMKLCLFRVHWAFRPFMCF